MRAVDGAIQLLVDREWKVESHAAVEVEADEDSFVHLDDSTSVAIR